MMTDGINGSSNAGSATDLSSATLPATMMGQEDFLKLLVAQLTTQNPMQPMTDTDFLGQMVQISTLQQNQSMQSQLATMQQGEQFQQANSLLGENVVLATGDQSTISGVVTAVDYSTGVPQLIVGGGSYPLDQVISVNAQ